MPISQSHLDHTLIKLPLMLRMMEFVRRSSYSEVTPGPDHGLTTISRHRKIADLVPLLGYALLTSNILYHSLNYAYNC